MVNENKQRVNEKYIVVKKKKNVEIAKIDFKNYGLKKFTVLTEYFTDDYFGIRIDDDSDIIGVTEKLLTSNLFEGVEPDLYADFSYVPSDPYDGSQWYLQKIDMNKAWDITKGSDNVNIAVADGGGDFNHVDLIDNKWSGTGYNFSNPSLPPSPYGGNNSHGTNCAGVIGAKIGNSLGVSGIAGGSTNEGVNIMHLSVANGPLSPSMQFLANAINWAADPAHKAKVINISINALSDPQNVVYDAINDKKDDLLIIVSTGNYKKSESNPDRYVRIPATYDGVLAVGAVKDNDVRKKWDTEGGGSEEPDWGSCWDDDGFGVNIVAPGIRIVTTDITGTAGNPADVTSTDGNYYLKFAGTSAAAPVVSGVAALIYSINEDLTPAQVINIFEQSAEKVAGMNGQNRTGEYGYGRLNAYKALKYTIENYGGTFNQDVTIPAGETWNIQSGKTLKFDSGKKLIVNGTLNATNSTFTSSSTNWSGITFNSGSHGNLNGCVVNNVHSYGGAAISIYNANPTIQYCTIENNINATGGIYITGKSNTPYLYYNTIRNNTYHGIYIYNAYANLRFNTVAGQQTSGRAAIYCDYYAYPLFAVTSGGYEEGRNTMHDSYYGLYAAYYSNVSAGSIDIAYKNRFINNSYSNVYATYYTTVYARRNWWGQPSVDKIYQINNSVVYTDNQLSTDPGLGAPLQASPFNETVVNSLEEVKEAVAGIDTPTDDTKNI